MERSRYRYPEPLSDRRNLLTGVLVLNRGTPFSYWLPTTRRVLDCSLVLTEVVPPHPKCPGHGSLRGARSNGRLQHGS
jgi:hypothetical protein